MRKLSILFAALFLIFIATQTFAQKKPEQKQIVVIKFLIPKQKEFAKEEVPIEKKSKLVGISETVINECGVPESGECNNSNDWTYTFSANAFRTRKAITIVDFKIKVNNECKTQNTFTVYQSRKTKLSLKCGVSLIAYYGLKTKEEN